LELREVFKVSSASRHLIDVLDRCKKIATGTLATRAYAGGKIESVWPWIEGDGYLRATVPGVRSTVGISVARSSGELEWAVANARLYDSDVMYERFVGGRELTVGLIGDEVLTIGEIPSGH
jgi:hypothetical protein